VESILRDIFETLHITSREMTIQSAHEYIMWAKTHTMQDLYIELLSDASLHKLSEYRAKENDLPNKVFFEYLYHQRKNFGFDFTDLIQFALHILGIDADVRDKWQKRLEYIMVDEFQDVNGPQYALAEILSDYHKNLFVVGDPDQTIYTWRGARIDLILDFDKRHPGCETILMNKNYRSQEKVINAANALIRKNKMRVEKDLLPVREGAGQALYFHAKTQTEEADWISTQVLALQEQGVPLLKIAVLYRAHYVSRSLEESFVRNKIPYKLYSGIEFYRRKEIKDLLSYLRLISAGDDLSFLRVINEPKRGIGKKRIQLLQEYSEAHRCSLLNALAENAGHNLLEKTTAVAFLDFIAKYQTKYREMTLTDLLTGILSDSGYEETLRVAGDEERLDNLAELKQSIYEYETTAGEDVSLEDYLEHIALFTNMDTVEQEAVKMMTIHAAKGLEFSFVFICGLSEGIFPSRKVDTKDKLEEERRLAYVGFTRAQDRLFLSDSEGFNYDGSFRFPSRFIFNAEPVNVDYVVELSRDLIDDATGYIDRQEQCFNAVPLFKVGDSVIHPVFGKGTILEIISNLQSYSIQFDGVETPRRISFTISLEREK